MYPIDDTTGSFTEPPKGAAGTERYFDDGDPATNRPATRVKASWLNMVQKELRAFLTYASITPDKSNDGQVLASVRAMFATLFSPAFTGTPTAPTPAAGDNSTKLATTEWVKANGGFVTGMVMPMILTTAPAGWVMLNDGAIGNAASGASTRANADTQALFVALWNSTSDSFAPVSGGRGASAVADFAASKTIALPRALGRALGVAGAGVGLTARPLGSTAGVEAVALAWGEMPPHQHTGTTNAAGAHYHNGSTDVQGDHQHTDGREGMYNDAGGGNYIGDRNWEYTSSIKYQFWRNALTSVAGAHAHNLTTTWAADHQHTITTDVSGSGTAHTNMQPTLFLNAMIKL